MVWTTIEGLPRRERLRRGRAPRTAKTPTKTTTRLAAATNPELPANTTWPAKNNLAALGKSEPRWLRKKLEVDGADSIYQYTCLLLRHGGRALPIATSLTPQFQPHDMVGMHTQMLPVQHNNMWLVYRPVLKTNIRVWKMRMRSPLKLRWE